TNAADHELAIKDLVHSAFRHAGQKCSAASLALVEADLYDSPTFQRQLRDAAASLPVGPAHDLASVVTPVTVPPNETLTRGLTRLDEGEEWLLQPRQIGDNPQLWTPGIRLGVKPGSWFHRSECFGPVLGLIRVDSLDHAIEIQNDSEFGLTGGLHSLDEREIAHWRDRVEVGNAYLNRPITGAIVRRQPFGGWKHSCFGPGAKAGGPNYVSIFGTWRQDELPKIGFDLTEAARRLLDQLLDLGHFDEKTLSAAARSQTHWLRREFGIEHDPSGLHGEDNHFRYRPLRHLLVRSERLSDNDIAILLLASAHTGGQLSFSDARERPWLRQLGYACVKEDEATLAQRLRSGLSPRPQSLRAPGAGNELRRAANAANLQLIDHPVLANARHELRFHHREQSISHCTHRYGNLIPKPAEIIP
ncbi:MAG: aldehyde dehydrogenase family protein, partial [Verrucomicrobiales bacterium]